jgi:cyclopropane fatty-acyl-phospholipid synthase-like methyltransferase
MTEEIRSAVDFYNRHPITAEIVLAKLQQSRGHLDDLTPEDLLAHDQDHYGGTAATDALAHLAGIGAGTRVADFCAGLGASARYLAHRYGADVTGIELTPARVTGAAELTRRVGLRDRVRMIEGDVMDVPLPDGTMDAVISQEALLHVPDTSRALAEAYRVLQPGGRVVFTTWIAPRPLSAADRDLLWRGMAVASLHSLEEYSDQLRDAGFTVCSMQDLTAEWGEILRERLGMYRKLRGEAEAAGTPTGHDAFYESYVLFVDLVTKGEMGGGRFAAVKA